MSRKVVLDSIEKNAARLIADNRRLREENGNLAAARQKLRDEVARLTAELAGTQRSLAVKQLVEGFTNEAGNIGGDKGIKAARTRVNNLLREVDGCIALLNKEN